MEVSVDNLTNFEVPKRYEHWDDCEGYDTTEHLKQLGEFMRGANMQLDTLRFVGFSYQLSGAGKRSVAYGLRDRNRRAISCGNLCLFLRASG